VPIRQRFRSPEGPSLRGQLGRERNLGRRHPQSGSRRSWAARGLGLGLISLPGPFDAARLAAEHIDEGTNRRLFADVWEKVQPTLTPLPWQIFIQQNRLYHATIVSISGNEQLSELIGNLQLPIMMYQIGSAMSPENAAISHEDHVRVAEAILAGEPEAAEQAMRRHLRSSHGWVTQLPDSAFKRQTDERRSPATLY
jgi:hypothetical protein